MYRRILTALTVAVAGLAIAVPMATAQQSTTQKLEEIGAWAVPSQTSVPKKALVNSKLEEIGAWAVPSQTSVAKVSVRNKLEEIGAWAVPSQTSVAKPIVSEKLAGLALTSSPTPSPATTGGNGFDWNDAGIGGAVVFGAMLIGTGLLVTMRHRHGPLAH